MTEKFNLIEFKALLNELGKGLKKAVAEDSEHPKEAQEIIGAIDRLQTELADVDEIDLSDEKYSHLLPDIQTVFTFIEIVTGEALEGEDEDFDLFDEEGFEDIDFDEESLEDREDKK